MNPNNPAIFKTKAGTPLFHIGMEEWVLLMTNIDMQEFVNVRKSNGEVHHAAVELLSPVEPASTKLSKQRKYNMNTPEIIEHLEPNDVFVFGSNLAGRHYGGAARIAYEKFGAQWGIGFGHTGQTFAIPTLVLPSSETSEATKMELHELETFIDAFYIYAKYYPHLTFFLTKIGCGVAGFTIEEIAEVVGLRDVEGFCVKASIPKNVVLPIEFEKYLNSLKNVDY